MAVKTPEVDSSDMSAATAFELLSHLRLERDWSFERLATEMRSAGHYVPAKTLHWLLTSRPEKPFARTLYKIRQYLASSPHQRRAS